MIPFAVEFGVDRFHSSVCAFSAAWMRQTLRPLRSKIRHNRFHVATSRDLRQQRTAIQIRHDHPFQRNVSSGSGSLPVMMHHRRTKNAAVDRSLH